MNEKPIYLDYHATTPVHPLVFDEMKHYFESEFGNPHSTTHSVGWSASKTVENARGAIADFVGAFEEDVIFTSGATEANNLAIQGYRKSVLTSERRKILCGPNEHKCVVEASRMLAEQCNLELDFLPVDANGELIMERVEELINEDVFLLSLMLVNNEIGTINDVKKISEICMDAGVRLHCDASQASIFYEMSILAELCTSISLSSHKMYGPTGIGCLVVSPTDRDDMLPLFGGGGQEAGFRSGTVSVPLTVGFAAACRLMVSDGFRAQIREASYLRDYFYQEIKSAYPNVALNGSQLNERHPLNLNLLFPDVHSDDLISALYPRVCVSTGSACSSAISAPSDTLLSLGHSHEMANSSVRFGFGIDNSKQQVDETLQLIANFYS